MIPTSRRWFVFRLRTLFVVVAIAAAPLGWLAYQRMQLWKQTGACIVLNKTGASIAHGRDDRPTWTKVLYGDDPYHNPTGVQFSRSTGDAALVNLRHLAQIDWLNLGKSSVSDAGLVQVGQLTTLSMLVLNRTRISDAGLKHLTNLKHLRSIDLSLTKVSDQGITELQKSLPGTLIIR
jgi:hypothetical protein